MAAPTVAAVLEAALASSWGAALVLAGTCTGEHTLPTAVVPAYDAVPAR